MPNALRIARVAQHRRHCRRYPLMKYPG
jgi:hypothetical protein